MQHFQELGNSTIPGELVFGFGLTIDHPVVLSGIEAMSVGYIVFVIAGESDQVPGIGDGTIGFAWDVTTDVYGFEFSGWPEPP